MKFKPARKLAALLTLIHIAGLSGCEGSVPAGSPEPVGTLTEEILSNSDITSDEVPYITNIICEYKDGYLIETQHPGTPGFYNIVGYINEDLSGYREMADGSNGLYSHDFAVKSDDKIYVYGRSGTLYIFDGDFNYLTSYDWSESKLNEEYFMTRDVFAKNGLLYFVSLNSIKAVDEKGNIVSNVALTSDDFYSVKYIYGDYLYLIKSLGLTQGSILEKRELSTLEVIAEYDMSQLGHEIPESMTYSDEDKLFYISTPNNIYSFNEETSEFKTVCSFNGSKIREMHLNGSSTVYLKKDGDYFTLFLSGEYEEGCSFARIKGINEAQKNNVTSIAQDNISKEKIKIFLPYMDMNIERYAYGFEEIYKDYDVEITSLSDSLFYRDEDYIARVNTELLSGNFDYDIVSCGLLNTNLYTDKGFFADITKIPGGDFYKDDTLYYSNIFEACKKENGLYIFPMFFSNAFLFTDNRLDTFEEVSSLADTWTWDDFINLIYKRSEAENKKVISKMLAFDDEMPTYATTTYIIEMQKLLNNPLLKAEDGFIDATSEFKRFTEAIPSDDEETTDEFAFDYYNGLSTVDPNKIFTYLNDHSVIPLPAAADGTKSFYLQYSYAVLENSKNKEMALKFLVYCLDNIDWISIDYSASKKDTESLKDTFSANYSVNYNEEKLDEFLNKIKKEKESLNFAVLPDFTANNSIFSQINLYIDGVINEETLASKVNDILWLYHNE